MKIGFCTNMNATIPDGTGIECIEIIKKLNYDYVELPLCSVADLSERKFLILKNELDNVGIKCEAFNLLFPERVRLTGNNINEKGIDTYIESALYRAGFLGAEVIVFGSAGARNVPQGFSTIKARAQLVVLLQKINKLAVPYGITIVVEPLNRGESNIINSTLDGSKLVEDVGCSNIKLLVDYYHWALEKDDYHILPSVIKQVKHVHISNPDKRVFLKRKDTDGCVTFLHNLKELKYDQRISVEAYTHDMFNDAKESFEVLKSIFN